MKSASSEGRLSIRQLFDNVVVLRNLEPTNARLRGLSRLRTELDIPAGVTPRKSEPLYARLVDAFVRDLSEGRVTGVIYVGDSVYNDGNAIRFLAEGRRFPVLGFLCNHSGVDTTEDLCVGEIIFSENWSNLWKLYSELRRRDFPTDQRLVALFDLDQTVYAAKGRDDEPLKRSRLDAVHSIIRSAVPPHRYEPAKVDSLYREFDRDIYHPVTKDNQDFVVFLTLASCLSLFDVGEVRRALESRMPIVGLIEQAMERVARIAQHEPLDQAVARIREVFFNSRVGDPTPFRTFREGEYLSSREWMIRDASNRDGDSLGAIRLNRQVVDLILFLKARGVRVMALSDRPLESTEPDPAVHTGLESLLDIPMMLSGTSIADLLAKVDRGGAHRVR